MSPRTAIQLNEIRLEKRERIEVAALHLFAQHGFDGTSIAQITKEARISKGLFYTYYESKDAILKHIIQDLLEQVFARFNFPENGKIGDAEFERFINVSLDMVLEDLNKFKFYFQLLTQSKVVEMLMEDLMKEMEGLILLFIDYYREKGIENPIAMMRFISSAIDGIQMHIMFDPENYPIKEVKQILLSIVTGRKDI